MWHIRRGGGEQHPVLSSSKMLLHVYNMSVRPVLVPLGRWFVLCVFCTRPGFVLLLFPVRALVFAR